MSLPAHATHADPRRRRTPSGSTSWTLEDFELLESGTANTAVNTAPFGVPLQTRVYNVGRPIDILDASSVGALGNVWARGILDASHGFLFRCPLSVADRPHGAPDYIVIGPESAAVTTRELPAPEFKDIELIEDALNLSVLDCIHDVEVVLVERVDERSSNDLFDFGGAPDPDLEQSG